MSGPGPADPAARQGAPRPDGASWLLGGYGVATVSVVLVAVDPRLRHWFLVPVALCGLLIAPDAVDWIRRRTDVFDPRALIGLLGLHFFYVAPVLHVLLDYWMREASPSHEWRDALGAMAVVNLLGLLVYRGVLSRQAIGSARRDASQLNLRTFWWLGLLAVAIGLYAFVTEIVLLGGIGGFLTIVTTNREALSGLGPMLVVAESFPLLAFALVLVRWRTALAGRPATLAALWVAFAAVQFVASGIRGSRNNTVWPVLVAIMLIHLLVRRITRKALVVLVVGFGCFMYAYGLYKGAGLDALQVVQGDRTVAEVSTETGRDVPTLLLGDLGRSDVQAVVLDRVRAGEVTPVYGHTYLAAPMFLAPQWLVPDALKSKVRVGTDIFFGDGAHESGVRSARVHGLAGEATLNFGPVGAVASFAVFGLIIGAARRYYERARCSPSLVGKLLAPSVSVLAASLLMWDVDNLAWFSVKHLLPLALLVAVARVPGSRAGGKGAGRTDGSVVADGSVVVDGSVAAR
jgi:hypothetical protein